MHTENDTRTVTNTLALYGVQPKRQMPYSLAFILVSLAGTVVGGTLGTLLKWGFGL